MNAELLREIEFGVKGGAKTKRAIINYLIKVGKATITDFTKELNLSIPTVTKFLGELMSTNTISQCGKLETSGGRYPILYGLTPEAGYFVGVDVRHNAVNIGVINFVGEMILTEYNIPFTLDNTTESLEQLAQIILGYMEEHMSPKDRPEVLGVNINLPGRINPATGFSYTMYNFDPDVSLAHRMSELLQLPVSLDNDTRGMTYGEYTQGNPGNREYKDVLYLNVSWGVGLGIILGGEIYLGKSGFSGEFGHISAYNNQILCRCGKKGCVETEASGLAMKRRILERIAEGEVSLLSEKVSRGEDLSLQDLIRASKQEDVLCLQVLAEIGAKLGRQVSSIINLFNPELVIIGGSLSLLGDQLTQAIQNEVRTYSLNLVNKDTKITTATLGERAGLIGSCEMARNRRF